MSSNNIETIRFNHVSDLQHYVRDAGLSYRFGFDCGTGGSLYRNGNRVGHFIIDRSRY